MKIFAKNQNIQKKAVFFFEKQLTDYIYTDIIVENGYQIAYTPSYLDVFDGDGRKCFSKDTILNATRDGYISIQDPNSKLFGVIYANGDEILPEKFHSIWLTKKCIKVGINHLYGCFSYSGTIIVPIKFNDMFTYEDYIKCIDYSSRDFCKIYSYSGKNL